MTAISLARHLQQPPDQQQVLKTRQILIDRRILAGQPDQLTDPVGLLDDVRAADQGVTGIGPQQRGQHPDHGGLPRAVRPQQAQHHARPDRQIDAVHCQRLPEPLDQAHRLDREWADRRGRRLHTMIGADLGRAALLATVPVCYALHVLTMTQLYLVTFAAGTLSILFNVSDATLLVSIVAPKRYLDGQSLIYGSRALSFMAGPSIGGLLVQVFTAPFAVIADALSFLSSAFFLRHREASHRQSRCAPAGRRIDWMSGIRI